VPEGSQKVPEELQHKLWWESYYRGLLGSPANLLSLSTPMDKRVVDDIVDRLTDAVWAVAGNQGARRD
jgi:glutamate-1-semialdehyde 2,1-aminomutase